MIYTSAINLSKTHMTTTDYILITLTPTSDMASLKADLAEQFKARARDVVFDVQSIQGIDSVWIGFLLVWVVKTRKEGFTVRLRGTNEKLRGTFELVGLGNILLPERKPL